jgi:hypothetical protein
MISYSTRILKFQKMGEKTGWSYIVISSRQARQLNPGSKVSFRVKGLLDHHPIQKAALIPMGEGNFILPINATLRRATRKKAGDDLKVQLELDASKLKPSSDFMKCLKDDPRAMKFFKSLPMSHQHYFSKWIESAKTIPTKIKRITMAVIALGSGHGFAEMLRANKTPR